jgi:hypothetical protein
MDKRKVSIGVAAILILGIGAAWALGYFHRTDPAVADLQQLGAQMRSASEADRPALFQQFREKMDGLSDAQRQEFRDNNQGRFRQDMAKRMNEFFAMSPADQQKRLDEIIDRMQKRQQQRQAGGGANGGGPGGGGPGGGGPGGAGRGGGGQNATDGGREQARKSRLDNTNPAERAQQDKFRAMMGDRMQQRGMSPPTGGGGFGGGGFGGRG